MFCDTILKCLSYEIYSHIVDKRSLLIPMKINEVKKAMKGIVHV